MADTRLDLLKQIAVGIAAQFGEKCEIAIHDLAGNTRENTIVYIENGHITGREEGDGPSEAVLRAIKHRNKPFKDQLAYLTRTNDGRILRSSTLYIRDDSGMLRYVLAINYDITGLVALENSIHAITSPPESKDSGKGQSTNTILHDVNGLLDELIEQSVNLVGIPVPLMTKEDKITAINFLNDTGAFLITKSGDKVAKYFGISKYTLYSYVDINK